MLATDEIKFILKFKILVNMSLKANIWKGFRVWNKLLINEESSQFITIK